MKQSKKIPTAELGEREQLITDLFEEKQKQLILENKDLTEEDFTNIEQLRTLKISNCQNTQKMLNQFTKAMPELQQVQIVRCGLTSLNSLRHLKKLTHLDVSENRLSDTEELLHLSKLPMQ